MIIDAYCTLGEERDECLTAERLLREMEKNGVARAVIAPGSRELAVANREGNARVAALAREEPSRFIPAFAVNPWFGADALHMAEEAWADGGRMLVLAPHRQGYLLGDSVCDPLVNWAGENAVPVYVPASPTSSATPSQLYFLADRFPHTRFLLGRGGTTDYAYDMAPILQMAPANLWYDLGFIRPGAFLRYAHAAPERLCFASCAPQNDQAYELQLLRQTLPEELFNTVAGVNFLRFLKEDLC